MATKKKSNIITRKVIASKILLFRGKKVMLDSDLAELYHVETKTLKRAVKRNVERFPEDFMFRLTQVEYDSLRRQIGALKRGQHSKYTPYVFTEQGVAMLSSVLNSVRAVEVNIQIMRAFVQMREMLSSYADLKRKIEKMEGKYDQQFAIVFDAIKQLIAPPTKPKKKIEF